MIDSNCFEIIDEKDVEIVQKQKDVIIKDSPHIAKNQKKKKMFDKMSNNRQTFKNIQ